MTCGPQPQSIANETWFQRPANVLGMAFEQITMFPNSAHEDVADAMPQCACWLLHPRVPRGTILYAYIGGDSRAVLGTEDFMAGLATALLVRALVQRRDVMVYVDWPARRAYDFAQRGEGAASPWWSALSDKTCLSARR